MNFRLIGIAALTLMLATPVMAMHRNDRHHYSHRELPIQHGYGSAYGAYASDRGYDVAPGNISNDFDRRNTFN